MATQAGHCGGGLVEIGAPVLGIETRGKGGGADEIAEHHRDRAALGREFRGLSRRGRRLRPCAHVGRRRRRQCGDGGEQLSPIAHGGDTDHLEVIDRQVRKDRLVDAVVAKRGLVTLETYALQPRPDVHARPQRPFPLSTGRIGLSRVAVASPRRAKWPTDAFLRRFFLAVRRRHPYGLAGRWMSDPGTYLAAP